MHRERITNQFVNFECSISDQTEQLTLTYDEYRESESKKSKVLKRQPMGFSCTCVERCRKKLEAGSLTDSDGNIGGKKYDESKMEIRQHDCPALKLEEY